MTVIIGSIKIGGISMFVGIGMGIICLIILIIKLPGWIESGELKESFTDRRQLKIGCFIVLGFILAVILIFIVTTKFG